MSKNKFLGLSIFFFMLFMSNTVKAEGQSLSFFMLNYTTGGGGGGSTGGTIDSLTSGSVSNAATMDVNISSFISSYQIIWIEFTAAPATNNVNLEALVSANGSTYDNSAGNYDYWFGTGGIQVNSASAAFIELLGNEVNTAGTRITGEIKIYDPNSSSYHPQLLFNCGGVGTQSYSVTGNGNRLTSQVTEAIRLLFSSGNITGYYKVYGQKN